MHVVLMRIRTAMATAGMFALLHENGNALATEAGDRLMLE